LYSPAFDADSDADSDAHADADSDADSDAHAHADADSDAHADADSDADSDAHADAHADDDDADDDVDSDDDADDDDDDADWVPMSPRVRTTQLHHSAAALSCHSNTSDATCSTLILLQLDCSPPFLSSPLLFTLSPCFDPPHSSSFPPRGRPLSVWWLKKAPPRASKWTSAVLPR
jgi:hypothetical protein